ncbi:MAG: chromate resistance protein ChrB domain-containing protein [Alphaproteobacteria bacterium]
MPGPHSLTADKLLRLVGRPDTPVLIDVRSDDDADAAPRLIPGAVRRSVENVAFWACSYAGRSVIAACAEGHSRSEGAAAWLRQAGAHAEILEGGYAAWVAAGFPLVPMARIPARGSDGSTLWVTRARPKIDRIACPWLIRRFVDPGARFLFVAPAEVRSVAARFDATPFDVEGEDIFWTHRGDLCSFDVMVEEFGLGIEPLRHLARIVRGADTARPDLAPEAAGLLAVSLGLSRMYADDIEQLEAGMLVYDALYRWSRDATGETHNWPTNRSTP